MQGAEGSTGKNSGGLLLYSFHPRIRIHWKPHSFSITSRRRSLQPSFATERSRRSSNSSKSFVLVKSTFLVLDGLHPGESWSAENDSSPTDFSRRRGGEREHIHACAIQDVEWDRGRGRESSHVGHLEFVTTVKDEWRRWLTTEVYRLRRTSVKFFKMFTSVTSTSSDYQQVRGRRSDGWPSRAQTAELLRSIRGPY
ncbi:hypothetical protein SCHPADRAFT_900952 [Schizopora paradoxa]|uniref:Uncharacterized protein n=1 Tax=Schizopora paradoxa TaxID=27342 RepID=A0A0H2SJ86_9AGAM|nr:hypothetical protein SCHPADRAFT_900952 [Schizopora paradoxa]